MRCGPPDGHDAASWHPTPLVIPSLRYDGPPTPPGGLGLTLPKMPDPPSVPRGLQGGRGGGYNPTHAPTSYCPFGPVLGAMGRAQHQNQTEPNQNGRTSGCGWPETQYQRPLRLWLWLRPRTQTLGLGYPPQWCPSQIPVWAWNLVRVGLCARNTEGGGYPPETGPMTAASGSGQWSKDLGQGPLCFVADQEGMAPNRAPPHPQPRNCSRPFDPVLGPTGRARP